MKRLWLLVLGATMAIGLLGPVRHAEARRLASHTALHHGLVRAQLASRSVAQQAPAPRPTTPTPARDHSSHRAAIPQVSHSGHHRAGPKPWHQAALGTPSFDLRHQDAGQRLARASCFVVSSEEHPVISGRGPPSVLHFQFDRHPAESHHALPILHTNDPSPTAAGPSRDPEFAEFPRVSFSGSVPARVLTVDSGTRGQSHEMCHLASRPKGAVAGHAEPFLGGVS